MGIAARNPSRERRDQCHFLSAISSAFFEWLLIILLFFDGLLSYLAIRFAGYCKLPTPCLLCSKLNQAWRREKPGNCNDFICNAHKLLLSSLAYCHTHQKLANAPDMCESCILSFSVEKGSNSEKYRLLLHKLDRDIDDGVSGDGYQSKLYGEDMTRVPLLNKIDVGAGSLSTRCCSCCSESIRSKSHANRLLLQGKPPIGASVAERNILLSGSQHGLTKGREKPSRVLTVYNLGDHGLDRLSHVGYSELKITSDSESEVPFSDDDDGASVVRGAGDVREEFISRRRKPSPVTIISKNCPPIVSEDVVLEKLIHPEPSLSDPEKKSSAGDSCFNAGVGHGLEEINWSQVEVKPDPPLSFEIESKHAEISSDHCVAEVGDVASISTTVNGGITKVLNSTDIISQANQIVNESCPTSNLNETFNLVTSTKSTLPYSNSTEISTGRESSRVPQDLKLRLSQISAPRWLEFPWNDMMTPSPKINGQIDECKLSDASSCNGLQNGVKRSSIDRNESGMESTDGSLVSEAEGESTVDRLKRQIEMDRKSMSILYKELEEERSASAIAANEAMAMINRLQEEKAAMQMDALQYLRMMEEQTEYDQEALEKLNDLLADREKEIQDLEAEVESYRRQFGSEPLDDKVLEPVFDSEGRETISTPRVIRLRSNDKSDRKSTMSKDIVNNTFKEFDDEKVYISECLRRLERKLRLFSNQGGCTMISESNPEDGLPEEKLCLVDNATMNGSCSKEPIGDNDLENSQNGGVNTSEKKDSTLLREESLPREESFVNKTLAPFSTQGIQFSLKDALKESTLRSISYNDRQFPMLSKRSDVIALGNEVSRLNVRLEDLEAERNFLEHTVKSLANGADGLQFIQEIASHLRELRKIGFTQRDQVVA